MHRPALRVSLDVGSERHTVVIGRGSQVLEQFEIGHHRRGFAKFFERIEGHRRDPEQRVEVLMEGAAGWIRPLDELIQQRGYRLLSINTLKMAHFRRMCAGGAKTDALDARRGLQVLELRQLLPEARAVCERVWESSEANHRLQIYTRRRRQLVQDKVRLVNRLHSQLQALCPGLRAITKAVDNQWFLRFLGSRPQVAQLTRMRASSVLRIRGIGPHKLKCIQAWQKEACWSRDVSWRWELVQLDVQRLLSLQQQLQQLEEQIQKAGAGSQLYQMWRSIPGFGVIRSGELAGEMGTVDRFAKESSLAIFLGTAPVDHSSGKRQGSRRPQLINRRAQNAFCGGLSRHVQQVEQSRDYYDRKYQENGGRHYKAIRALGRHLVRVVWTLCQQGRPYEIRPC